MKYQTFRTLLLGVASAAVLLGGFTAYKVISGDDNAARPGAARKALPPVDAAKKDGDKPKEPAPLVKEPAPAPAKEAGSKGKEVAKGDGLRPVDRQVLAHLQRRFAGDRLKDVFPNETYKVNVAKEGSGFRIKLDLNRDGHWDEKWTAKDDEVKRQVAPADDESYSESYRLDGESWRKK